MNVLLKTSTALPEKLLHFMASNLLLQGKAQKLQLFDLIAKRQNPFLQLQIKKAKLSLRITLQHLIRLK
jgi:hypothetical protein